MVVFHNNINCFFWGYENENKCMHSILSVLLDAYEIYYTGVMKVFKLLKIEVLMLYKIYCSFVCFLPL